MKILTQLLLTVPALLMGQGQPSQVDPYALKWDIDCQPKGCLMFLDIPHGDLEKPEYLTVTVAINKADKSIAFISFIVPGTADKQKGLWIGFADSYRDEFGEWSIKLAEGTTRMLTFEKGEGDTCTARELKGVVPSNTESPELNLLDQFLKHRMVLFFYWVNGERVKASATLSGFQAQYPIVLKEKL